MWAPAHKVHVKYHPALSHSLPPIHALEPVQEKEELDFYILSLQDHTAAMWLGLSEVKARCGQTLPSPTDLFPSMTNNRPACTSREQTSPEWQFLGRNLVYLSVPHLITLDGTYRNRFSSKWHAKALMKSGLLSDVNHLPFASSKVLSMLEKQDSRSASAQKCTAKPGLAIHCSKMRSSVHGFQPVLLHFVLTNRLPKLLDVLPCVFLSILWRNFHRHWSWNMCIGMDIY